MESNAHIVIDVPESIAPEQAAQLLNAPGEGFFLVQVLPIAGGHRAYLRRYKQKPPSEDAEAIIADLVKSNPNVGLHKIREVLKARGIRKGVKWIKVAKANGTGATLTQS